MSSPAKTTFDWADFGNAVDDITSQVSASGFVADCVLAVTRGGLILGGAVAHRLHIKDVICVNVEYYQGNGLHDVRLPEPVILPPGIDVELFRDKRVLLIDDIVDSGGTLAFLLETLSSVPSETRCATWIYKGRHPVPDFFAKETTDWVVAPWSPHSPFAHVKR